MSDQDHLAIAGNQNLHHDRINKTYRIDRNDP